MGFAIGIGIGFGLRLAPPSPISPLISPPYLPSRRGVAGGRRGQPISPLHLPQSPHISATSPRCGVAGGRRGQSGHGRRRRGRANSNFSFSTVLATLTREFRSTMRDRPRLLRAKVRQLHQVSLRGMGASNSPHSRSYAVFRIGSEIEILAFSAICTAHSCIKEHTEKAR